MTKEQINNQEVITDEGFIDGDGYPSCEGTPCDNMAEEGEAEEAVADNVSEDKSDDTDIWKDKFLRLQAEFDNYRKRTLKEKMDLTRWGGDDTIKAILPVVDDVERAVVAMEKSDDIDALRAGVTLIANKFAEILKQRGIEPIEAIGLELDTDHHEAVARFAAGEEQKGKIIDVVQKGYIHDEKVLRFAKVVVGE